MIEPPFSQGPFLSAALLCDRVLIEQDNTKSAIRIVDRITRFVAGPELRDSMEPFDHEMTLFPRFKSGRARGAFQLKIELLKPSGDSVPILNQTAIFEGEDDRGLDVVIPMRMGVEMAGVYWFRAYLNDEIIARTPLRVVYSTAITQGPSGARG